LVRRAVLYGRAAAGKNGAKRAFAISGWKIGGTGCGRRLMPISGPIELGGIERRHLNHHQVHIDPAMQFRTQAVGEPADPRIWRRNTPMQRYSPAAEAEPTWTIVPRLRGRIRCKAAIVP
jgi:hypothetical protein